MNCQCPQGACLLGHPFIQSLEYLAARCTEVTKCVIFHAASWSAYAWEAHREAFSLFGVTPILKLMGSEPISLDPPS